MRRIARRSAFRAIAAAWLGFAIVLLGTAAPSAAASYTLDFTATIFNMTGSFASLPPGAPLAISVTIDTFSSIPTGNTGFGPSFDQGSASFRFVAGDGGFPTFGGERGGTGAIFAEDVSSHFPGMSSQVYFVVQDSSSSLEFGYGTNGPGPLSSIAGLPNSSAAIMAFLGGTPSGAGGVLRDSTWGTTMFNITIPATVTPIPAALPLFVSALGGLGFIAWRGRAGRPLARGADGSIRSTARRDRL